MNQEKKQQNKPRGRPWPPGFSGNPHGRPKGSLNKLSLAVRGWPLAVNEQAGLEPEPAPSLVPVKFDPRQDHENTMTMIGRRWRRTVEQDGRLFDRETGLLIETPCRAQD